MAKETDIPRPQVLPNGNPDIDMGALLRDSYRDQEFFLKTVLNGSLPQMPSIERMLAAAEGLEVGATQPITSRRIVLTPPMPLATMVKEVGQTSLTDFTGGWKVMQGLMGTKAPQWTLTLMEGAPILSKDIGGDPVDLRTYFLAAIRSSMGSLPLDFQEGRPEQFATKVQGPEGVLAATHADISGGILVRPTSEHESFGGTLWSRYFRTVPID